MPFDEEILKQALDREAERELAEIPLQEELEGIFEVSPEFYKRMEHLMQRHKVRAWINTMGRNVAILIVMLVSTLILLCAINEDVRATCLRWIRTMMSGGMTQYQSVTENGKVGRAAGFMLDYIPEGYVLKTADMDDEAGYVVYCKGKVILEFNYAIEDGTSVLIDHEDSFLHHWTLTDGTLCDLYVADIQGDKMKLIWQCGAYICELYAMDLDEDEIFEIAEHVRMIAALEK